MNFTFRSRSRAQNRAGFSLAEVAIATAIAALGIVSLLGLIPISLDNLRSAGETVVTSRICQQLIGEMQGSEWGQPIGTSEWSSLQRYKTMDKNLYYDSEGTQIDDTSSELGMRLAYVAKIQILDGVATLPGYGMVTDGTLRDVKRIIIHVAPSTRTGYDFFNTSAKHERRAYTIVRQK